MIYIKFATLLVVGLASSLFIAPSLLATNEREPEALFQSRFATWDFAPEHKLHALVFRLDRFDDLTDQTFNAMAEALIKANEAGFATKRIGCTPLTCLMRFFNPTVRDKKSAMTEARGRLLFSEFTKKEPFVPPAFAANSISPYHAYMLAYCRLGEKFLFNEQVHELFQNRLRTINLPIDASLQNEENAFLKYLFIYYLVRGKLGELPEGLFTPLAYVNPLWNELATYKKSPVQCYRDLEDALKTSESWRLCMDFDQQKAGESWVHYETREPGTIPSLLKAFETLLTTQGKPVSRDLLTLFHGTATAHLADRVRRERSTSFGINVDRASLLFLLTFAARYGKFARLDMGCYTADYQEFSNGYMLDGEIVMVPVPNVSAIIDYHIGQTLKSTDSSTNEYLRVVSVIELSHTLVILHPYADGHTRSYVTLLLNKALMDLGIPFSAFGNPNAFDVVTAAESLGLILEGIRNFDTIRKGNLPAGMKSTAEIKKIMPATYDRNGFVPK